MSFLDDLEIPVRIRDPVEIVSPAAVRQQIRHLQTVSTTDKGPFNFIVPTGVYWIMNSLIIQYNANSTWGQRSVVPQLITNNVSPVQTFWFASSAIVNRGQGLVLVCLPGVGSSDTELTDILGYPNNLMSIRPLPAILSANQRLVIASLGSNSGEQILIDIDYVEVASNGT
jgi:hypothetical protein